MLRGGVPPHAHQAPPPGTVGSTVLDHYLRVGGSPLLYGGAAPAGRRPLQSTVWGCWGCVMLTCHLRAGSATCCPFQKMPQRGSRAPQATEGRRCLGVFFCVIYRLLYK